MWSVSELAAPVKTLCVCIEFTQLRSLARPTPALLLRLFYGLIAGLILPHPLQLLRRLRMLLDLLTLLLLLACYISIVTRVTLQLAAVHAQ